MILPETLKKILIDSGFIKQEDFDSAKKTADDLGKSISDILIFRGLITEDMLGKLIAEHYKVPYVPLKNKVIPLEVLQSIPEQAATSFHMVPFSKDEGMLHLAMEDPHDIEALEFAKRQTNLQVRPYFMTAPDFSKVLGQYKKNIKSAFKKIIDENIEKSKTVSIEEAEKAAEELPVIKILDTILEYAQAEGASDIHLESLEDSVLVRFRIDGILRDILTLPPQIHAAIVARIKILSSLKIDEHRTPQDGRFKFQINQDFISLRVSVLPAFFGENIVMRLLPESTRPLSLEELGISGKQLEGIRKNIKKPHGMILVTGPTGSGKTTTLYSILNILNVPEVKLCTVEDPIEYSIRRINQTQVNQSAGLNFASGLRSLLRHDPDVIMIGEIRDNETAEISIHASLTGHLVLSTLHTNSASGAIPRFLDMGAEGFLLASTINVIIAQRLVRKICQACIERYEPSEEIKEFIARSFGVSKDNIPEFFKGNGCEECGSTGYKGRIGVYEVLEVGQNIRDLIIKRTPEEKIKEQAIKDGMITLTMDGLNKASAGATTIEEILRVTRE
ncbi:GspE/PulE family protein [Patescibacteria group bacterium]